MEHWRGARQASSSGPVRLSTRQLANVFGWLTNLPFHSASREAASLTVFDRPDSFPFEGRGSLVPLCACERSSGCCARLPLLGETPRAPAAPHAPSVIQGPRARPFRCSWKSGSRLVSRRQARRVRRARARARARRRGACACACARPPSLGPCLPLPWARASVQPTPPKADQLSLRLPFSRPHNRLGRWYISLAPSDERRSRTWCWSCVGWRSCS